jgi:hypothetical protein
MGQFLITARTIGTASVDFPPNLPRIQHRVGTPDTACPVISTLDTDLEVGWAGYSYLG